MTTIRNLLKRNRRTICVKVWEQGEPFSRTIVCADERSAEGICLYYHSIGAGALIVDGR